MRSCAESLEASHVSDNGVGLLSMCLRPEGRLGVEARSGSKASHRSKDCFEERIVQRRRDEHGARPLTPLPVELREPLDNRCRAGIHVGVSTDDCGIVASAFELQRLQTLGGCRRHRPSRAPAPREREAADAPVSREGSANLCLAVHAMITEFAAALA
jgi:hypothetical protein